MNHSPDAKVAWDFNSDTCAIQTDVEIEPGQEILNNYGPKSNEELLMGYGFCFDDNPADSFGLGFNPSGEFGSDHLVSIVLPRY